MQPKISLPAFLLGLAMTLSPERSGSQEIISTTWSQFNGPGQFQFCNHGLGNNYAAGAKVKVSDWHPLADREAVQKLLSPFVAEGMTRCPSATSLGVNVVASVDVRNIVGGINPQQERDVIAANWTRATGQWTIRSYVPLLVQNEEQIARDRAQQQQQTQQLEAQKQKQLAAMQAAQKDCGIRPSVSGGPWVSSTYKTAALDTAQELVNHSTFGCVKTIEYVGPAVNPFGGNAARAKFSGYDGSEYKPYSAIRDFPY